MVLALSRRRGRSAHRHPDVETAALEPLGRLGLVARGVVYCVVAWLAVLVATGDHSREADRSGALATVAAQPFGRWLLWVMAAGFAGYAAWRFGEAVIGRTSTERDAGPVTRLAAAARGVLYVTFAASTAKFAMTDHVSSGAQHQAGWTAEVLSWPGGRLLVGGVGLAVIGAGVWNLWRAVTARFMRKLDRSDIDGRSEPTARLLGTVGHVGRGVAFGLVGSFIVQAAVQFDPQESRGLDGALGDLAGRNHGPALLVALATCLGAFGLFSFVEARWRRMYAD